MLYDLVDVTISLPQDKLQEIRKLLRWWESKKTMNLKQLQRIVGKLQFTACCVRAGTVFVNRLYDVMARMCDHIEYIIMEEVKCDLKWWARFICKYNGKLIMWHMHKKQVNELIVTDASLSGIGGFSMGKYFHEEVDSATLSWLFYNEVGIVHMEMLAIIVAVRLWHTEIAQK